MRIGDDASLYERDFHQWAEQQTQALREHRYADLDIEKLCEEVEILGHRERREAKTRLRTVLGCLLKLAYHPSVVERQQKRHSWQIVAGNARDALDEILKESPSLQPVINGALEEVYRRAVKEVARLSAAPASAFPENCPWSLSQVIDEEFWPEPPPALNLPPEPR